MIIRGQCNKTFTSVATPVISCEQVLRGILAEGWEKDEEGVANGKIRDLPRRRDPS